MNVFIQQPYFFPWLGFFAKYFIADIYIALDDVNLRRNDVRRTKLISKNKIFYFTCPVGFSQNKLINQCALPRSDYIKKFVNFLENNYSKCDFYSDEFPFVTNLLSILACGERLSETNIKIIENVACYLLLGAKTIYRSSDISKQTDRDCKTVELLRYSKASHIIVGDGKALSVHDFCCIRAQTNVSLTIMNCYKNHPKYIQNNSSPNEFVSGLSFLDCLFNVGRHKTADLIKNLAQYTKQ